ncbi:hypothetical protein [Streptomyces sp. NPDC088789]|uniref:hypothetical protein n=1 Tax=Streptomyces sp. NPDC088789 TaxID=3365899 RepID=UPI003813A46E
MTQLICDDDSIDAMLEDGTLREVYDWFEANLLGRVYLGDPVTVDTERGQRVIRYTLDVTPLDGLHKTAQRTVPLLVEPPEHWAQRWG